MRKLFLILLLVVFPSCFISADTLYKYLGRQNCFRYINTTDKEVILLFEDCTTQRLSAGNSEWWCWRTSFYVLQEIPNASVYRNKTQKVKTSSIEYGDYTYEFSVRLPERSQEPSSLTCILAFPEAKKIDLQRIDTKREGKFILENKKTVDTIYVCIE